MTAPATRRLLTAAEAAEVLGISIWSIYDFAQRGILPPGVVVRMGATLRVDAARLDEWLAAGGTPRDGAGVQPARRRR